MRKTIALWAALLLLLWPLAGCDSTPAPSSAAAAATTAPALATESAGAAETPTAQETPTATPTPEPTPTRPLPDDVYALFERVGFAGQADEEPVVEKWTMPLRIEVLGNPNDGDRAALGSLIDGLRSSGCLPEILLVTESGNLVIGFLPKSQGKSVDSRYNGEEDATLFADRGDGKAGPSAHLFIADEWKDETARGAALATLLFRALGLAPDPNAEHSDSVLREDNATATAPSALDWQMLALLYDPALKPGMTADQAMTAVYGLNPAPAAGAGSASAGATREDLLAYMNETGFYWADSARDGIVSKWSAPVRLQLSGSPADGQRELLDQYVEKLNQIAGFPGIESVQSGSNFIVTYAPRAKLVQGYPQLGSGEACYFRLEHGKNGALTHCAIFVATDFADSQAARSQFLRLLAWSMGVNFTSDTWPDSILNRTANAQDWSSLDWSVIGLLYRADVAVGTPRAQVMATLVKAVK